MMQCIMGREDLHHALLIRRANHAETSTKACNGERIVKQWSFLISILINDFQEGTTTGEVSIVSQQPKSTIQLHFSCILLGRL